MTIKNNNRLLNEKDAKHIATILRIKIASCVNIDEIEFYDNCTAKVIASDENHSYMLVYEYTVNDVNFMFQRVIK